MNGTVVIAIAMYLCTAVIFGGLLSIAISLERIAKAVKNGVVQTEDVARAKVYSEHLGEKLKKG